MKVIKVSYRENRSSRSNRFCHRHVELTAELEKGETEETVLQQLRTRVRLLLYPELNTLIEGIKKRSKVAAKMLAELSQDDVIALLQQDGSTVRRYAEGDPEVRVGDVLQQLADVQNGLFLQMEEN